MKNKSVVIILLFIWMTISNARILDSQSVIDSDSTFRPYLIAIVVVNVENTAAWYKDKLNFDIIRKMEFPEYDSLKIIHMKFGEVELELIQKKTSFTIKKYVPDYNGFANAPLQGIAKIAFYIHDVNTLANKLKSMDVKFLVKPYDDKDFGVRSFIIEDIDGNILQFNQRLK